MKPVGNSLFTYEEDRKEWTNWFCGYTEKIHRWDSKVYEPQEDETFREWISLAETWTRISLGRRSDFSVLTIEERFSEIL